MKNKLKYDEQYGYWAYYVDEEIIYDLKEVKINNTKYKVFQYNNTEVSYEMGHRNIVNSTKYYIRAPFEGMKVLVDLVQVMDKKTVTATKFSIEKPKPAVSRRQIK